MESNKSYERLLKLGFRPTQIEHLHRLRSTYAEREQIVTERRRLEFARWLVANGRLTDELHGGATIYPRLKIG